MKQIIIFASGSGTNTQRIIEYFHGGTNARIAAVYCNRPEAGVVTRAKNLGVDVRVFARDEFISGIITDELVIKNPDLIVLAGFLWLIPKTLIAAFPNKIINIHPALLPKHGGKGMYGQKVHTAVIETGDAESGLTIHYVDEKYDHGSIIFQAKCRVDPGDTPETLAQKIHKLEHRYYPVIIEQVLDQPDARITAF
ncbi:MAG: phosphoribosylglycinamide formyltransferase [Bacteroidetes bacterium]|nr:phosphoribosylglycinamide formyltransferase [Bacteroidota bacterium]